MGTKKTDLGERFKRPMLSEHFWRRSFVAIAFVMVFMLLGSAIGANANTDAASHDKQSDQNNLSTTILSEQTPVAATDGASNSPTNNTHSLDRTSLDLAVILLTIVAVLGFLLLVKNRRKENREKSTWWLK
jgi:ABC-type Fe3+ transport system permease subunit